MFSIYKKELQSYFYTPFAYIITGLFMLLFTSIFNTGLSDVSSNTYMFSFAEAFYDIIFYFIFLVPIMTMRIFADERKFGTEVLLMSSPANVFTIVSAKFLAAATVFIFMLLGASLFPIVASCHGEVVISQLICAYVGFFFWGLMCIALGMLISSFTENSIIAAIMGEVAMVALIYIDDISRTAFVSQYPKLRAVLYAFAAQPKFYYFSQGLFRLSDLVFLLSAIIIFLAWTIIHIEKRRWNRG